MKLGLLQNQCLTPKKPKTHQVSFFKIRFFQRWYVRTSMLRFDGESTIDFSYDPLVVQIAYKTHHSTQPSILYHNLLIHSFMYDVVVKYMDTIVTFLILCDLRSCMILVITRTIILLLLFCV